MNSIRIDGHLTTAVLNLPSCHLLNSMTSPTSAHRTRQTYVKPAAPCVVLVRIRCSYSAWLTIEVGDFGAETVDEGEDDDGVLVWHVHVVADEVQEEGRRDVEGGWAHWERVVAGVGAAAEGWELVGKVQRWGRILIIRKQQIGVLLPLPIKIVAIGHAAYLTVAGSEQFALFPGVGLDTDLGRELTGVVHLQRNLDVSNIYMVWARRPLILLWRSILDFVIGAHRYLFWVAEMVSLFFCSSRCSGIDVEAQWVFVVEVIGLIVVVLELDSVNWGLKGGIKATVVIHSLLPPLLFFTPPCISFLFQFKTCLQTNALCPMPQIPVYLIPGSCIPSHLL